MGYDGPHSLSQEHGRDLSPTGLYRWLPWLPFYVTAASFTALGESTWSARSPFALAGIATVLLTYGFAWRIWNSRRVALIAALILSTSVPFLLLTRQCRYYSLSMLFVVLSLWGWHELVKNRKRGATLFLLGATGTMHSFHFFGVTLLVAVALHTFLFQRALWKTAAVLLGGFMAAHLPWLWWMSGVGYNSPASWKIIQERGLWSIRQIVFEGFTPVLLLAAVVLALARPLQEHKAEYNPATGEPEVPRSRAIVKRCIKALAPAPDAFPLCLIALLLLITTAFVSLLAPASFFRYLAILLPLIALLAAAIVYSAFNLDKKLGFVAIAGFVAWNSIFGWWRDYYYEMAEPYQGPISTIVAFLRQHAKPEDEVLITYGDLPLKFYTNHRIYGGMTGEPLDEARDADWLIPRSHTISPATAPAYSLIHELLATGQYAPVVLPVADLPYENREEPNKHQYHTEYAGGQVYIYYRNPP
jgi:4-amino-4-deoxy-L-arabinose transferase-like glycosyltransferase